MLCTSLSLVANNGCVPDIRNATILLALISAFHTSLGRCGKGEATIAAGLLGELKSTCPVIPSILFTNLFTQIYQIDMDHVKILLSSKEPVFTRLIHLLANSGNHDPSDNNSNSNGEDCQKCFNVVKTETNDLSSNSSISSVTSNPIRLFCCSHRS